MGLALTGGFLYKPGFPRVQTVRRVARRGFSRRIPHGRAEEENLALAAWHAPFGRRTQAAVLCRGQGFGRDAASAPHRSEDRHVQGPAGAEAEDRGLSSGVCDKVSKPEGARPCT